MSPETMQRIGKGMREIEGLRQVAGIFSRDLQ